MHYQDDPAPEAKFIRCVQGAIFDAVVDMREGSPTYLRHFAVELSADSFRALYVPERFAHGYQALTDDAIALYSASAPYTPGSERGIRYNDPLLGIHWPLEAHALSEKDASWPLLERQATAANRL
jgi:dTDP-4-dehydrorhamnose 3,5-epimerase